MGFKGSNRMTASEQQSMDKLLALISVTNNEELKFEADMYRLRKTFSTGMDGQSEEQQQYNGSNSDKNVSNAQKEYDRKRIEARSMGTTGDSYDRNRAASMNKANDNEFTEVNVIRSKGFSGFDKPSYSR